MDIKIPLTLYSNTTGDYKGINSILKQLELSIHHAQKAVESAEKNGVEISEDSYVVFEYSSLVSSLKLDEHKKEIPTTSTNFMDNYYEELQNPELVIHLQ